MDMQTPPPQGQPQDQGADPAALLKQAQDLITQALAAMGAEESAEGEQSAQPDQAAQRASIAKQVFGGAQ